MRKNSIHSYAEKRFALHTVIHGDEAYFLILGKRESSYEGMSL